MKKFLSVLLLLTLLLSLSVSVFARYEVCPECEGRMIIEIEERVIGSAPCPVLGDDGVEHDVIGVYELFYCSRCDYEERETVLDTYVDCPH